jgi:hypothetical protein
MNAKRINLVECVRVSLTEAGYSTVKVVNAVNAELGRLAVTKGGSEAKLGDGRVTKTEYRVTEDLGSVAYKGGKTPGLVFDAWHSAIAKANKVAEMDAAPIPAHFSAWLQSMKADVIPAAPIAPAVETAAKGSKVAA